MKNPAPPTPIAIVGTACLLPGATSPGALFSAVAAGRDLIRSAPEDRWGLSRATALTGDPDHSADRAWSDRGGYVTGFDDAFRSQLQADPFRRPAEDLLALDPLFHWVLHTGRRALREAGHDGSEGKSDRVGAAIGNLSFPSSAMSRFAEGVWLPQRPSDTDPRNRFMSGLPALLLADELGIGGGAIALDAACASSLYAIKLACDQLQDGTLDLALAGAVCRSDDLFIHVGFCALDAMSRTGRSRPFHAEADGLVPAEGAAMVALKRLDDAVAAGNRIYGVIRGVGLSNDGRGRGLLAPDTPGQARALANAWRISGLDPKRLGLVECHATGTPVGDATEIRTLHTALGEVEGLPLGSLKSNLGHLITAAGAAGLLKVLGAFEAEMRPPTLHASTLNPALADTPFRVLTEAEPWPEGDEPRLACVSAFGFGGNNAHLIVEQHTRASAAPSAATLAPPRGDVVVVGLGVRAAGVRSAADLHTALLDGRNRIQGGSPARGLADAITLPLETLKFPPKDLAQTLPQQLLALAAALEATDGIPLPQERTAVLLGSQSDPEVCRYGARWRLADWFAHAGDAWVAEARDGVVPVLQSAGVVGNMPNIPANRIGSQLDLGGPGFTLAAEEHSGLVAVRTAARMLRAGEVDVALAGAVDLSAEPVHEAAAAAVLGPVTTGDAAVVLTLMRREDAEAASHPILGILTDGDGAELRLGPGGHDLAPQLGRAHAAHSALHLAAAVLACAHGVQPVPAGPGAAWTTPERSAVVRSRSMTGTELQLGVRSASRDPLPAPGQPAPPQRPLTFPSHPPPVRIAPLPGEATHATMPAAPQLAPTHVAAGATGGSTGFDDETSTMAAAPELARITPLAAEEPTPRRTAPARPAGPVPTMPTAAAIPAPPAAIRPAQPTVVASGSAGSALGQPQAAGPHLAQLALLHRQISAAHQAYLEQQQALHAQFLAVRQRTTQQLFQAVQERTTGGSGAVSIPPLTPPARAVAPVPPPIPPVAPAPTPIPSPPPAPGVTPPRSAAELPGPKFSREQLESLASDEISAVFGPQFAIQDDFPRQVRMPEPPLLLADRVTGIDAEPGSMTTGTIWTETDVTWDAWYLHDGVMPAGAMIEAGQADLLLISYLGADFRNRGERVYRLLGCQLIYQGGLPRPGQTLHYEIHIDGHANVGDTAIFFFHYDCVDDDGHPRLIVREGQAGFFTDEELADSGGILWSAETGEHDATARLDPPAVRCTKSSFSSDDVLAFSHGDGFACFGHGYERLQTHVRSPRMAPPPMSFWQRVTHCDPSGGPWGRGYLRAEQDIAPSDWFFDGHFKDDPCMPGTMMFEACLQAMAFYLTSLGYTLRHDGWSFEPVPDLAYDLRCRGQVIPSSRDLVYEVFVEEVHDGPFPTVYADVLCTIDGLKAFWARRVGLRLRPDWPITSRPEVLGDHVEPEAVAQANGFPFGYASLVACAWGKPSDAFGPMYRPFDEGRHCARLPGPPYHFMSRVTHIDGAIGGMEVGTAIELSYDIPPDAWYFDENGHRTMPFAVLLEAALQPCGWIACYVGSALTTDQDLYFRNLDGTATWHRECLPDSGTLVTKAKITSISQSGGMIIEAFEVECSLDGEPIYDMKTVFGFFPGAALANQIGIVPTDEERAELDAPSDFLVDLTTSPQRYCGRTARLADPMLRMLDRVTAFWPDGGSAGLGRLRSEKDVDPSEWFFKAHFYTDPVQPGSLGIEALIQLLQFFMLHTDMDADMASPRFEPLMIGRELTWKYRGQVIPENDLIRCQIDITEVGRDEHGPYAICDGYLWVDDLRIYQAVGMGMRLVDDGLPLEEQPTEQGASSAAEPGEEILDPARQAWIGDHRPTFTVPALPAMSLLDRLAAAAVRAHGGTVTGLSGVQIHGWVKVDNPARLRPRVEPATDQGVPAFVDVWRTRSDDRLSRFEPAASGTVGLSDEGWPEAPAVWPALTDVTEVSNPYASGALFHGPAFQCLTSLSLGPSGATAQLDATRCTVPPGTLHQGLLDAVLHAIPHDALHQWSDRISPDLAAYPHYIDRIRFFGPAPAGRIRVEARFDGIVKGAGDLSFPRIRLQAVDLEREQVWLEMTLIEVLLPKGPIGSAAGPQRVAFLRDRRPVAGLALSEVGTDGTATATAEVVRQSDWLPGTVAAVYRSSGDRLVDVAVGDHVARLGAVHPGTVTHDGHSAVSTALPLTRWPIAVARSDEGATVRSAGAPQLDLEPIVAYWDRFFGLGRWPVEDIYYSLIRRFVRQVRLQDPDAHAAIAGRSVLYLANHQVGVESLLFSILASGLNGVNTVTLAKAEHRTTWLGRLIAHCFSYPEAVDPEVITFFDRQDKRSLPRIIGELAAEMASGGKSVMVHVEGTRSLSCRTPVTKMSGAFVDMAMNVDAPIVPVRFVGGLPAEPLTERLEFPVGMGRQDVWLGKPILPETLRALTYKDRKDLVVAAMNSFGPPHTEETPFPGDPALEAATQAWVQRTGAERPHAALLQVLIEADDLTEATQRLIAGASSGQLDLGDSPQDRWLSELASRLYGKAR
ncbi:MAG: polyketide synthase dehydratase domain-containing protein [Myxococcales bacterium]|nr:polyketide synthase dehydratase domain-containing protein [Myxococcales bacterium]